MNLFKKVLIVGLATMALGSAAMGDTGTKCEMGSQSMQKAGPPPTGDNAPAKQGVIASDASGNTTPATPPTTPQ